MTNSIKDSCNGITGYRLMPAGFLFKEYFQKQFWNTTSAFEEKAMQLLRLVGYFAFFKLNYTRCTSGCAAACFFFCSLVAAYAELHFLGTSAWHLPPVPRHAGSCGAATRVMIFPNFWRLLKLGACSTQVNSANDFEFMRKSVCLLASP